MSLLEVKNLQVRVEDREILHGLSLTVNPGEVHAIMGPNGSGKSTLSHVIAGKPGYEVTGGEIIFKGENLLEMAPDERAAKGPSKGKRKVAAKKAPAKKAPAKKAPAKKSGKA